MDFWYSVLRGVISVVAGITLLVLLHNLIYPPIDRRILLTLLTWEWKSIHTLARELKEKNQNRISYFRFAAALVDLERAGYLRMQRNGLIQEYQLTHQGKLARTTDDTDHPTAAN